MKSFEMWLKRVNELVEIEIGLGLSLDDLPDQPYRDWYDDELMAEEVADRIEQTVLD